MIHSLDPGNARTATPENWSALKDRIGIGSTVSGVVKRVAVFGMFVDLGEAFPGFVDVLDLPDKVPEPGTRARFRVLGFPEHSREVRLVLDSESDSSSAEHSAESSDEMFQGDPAVIDLLGRYNRLSLGQKLTFHEQAAIERLTQAAVDSRLAEEPASPGQRRIII